MSNRHRIMRINNYILFHQKLAALCCNLTYFSTLASMVGVYGLIYWVIVVHSSRKKKKNDTVSWSEMNRLNFTKSSHVFVKCTCCNWKDWRYSRFYCLTSAVLLDKPFYERNMKLFFKKKQSTVMMVTLLQAVQEFSLWPTNEDKNKRFKINLRRFRKTSGLFRSLTKELNSGLPWTNQVTCSRTWHVQCRTLVKHRVGL